jgi:hypothetical protein
MGCVIAMRMVHDGFRVVVNYVDSTARVKEVVAEIEDRTDSRTIGTAVNQQ